MGSLHLAEREQSINEYDMRASHRYDLIASLLSFSLLLILILAAIGFAYYGKPIEGFVSIIGAIVLLWQKKKS